MSLTKRLWDVARAELSDAARRLQDSAEQLLQQSGVRRSEPSDEELERAWADHLAEESGRSTPRPRPQDDRIQRYYANLELERGATRDEVRAAYRRLMRKYHPDRHTGDPARVRAATELAQQLREAHDGLLLHLKD